MGRGKGRAVNGVRRASTPSGDSSRGLFVVLGVFVAFLQAFIFSFLTIIYIGLALEDAH